MSSRACAAGGVAVSRRVHLDEPLAGHRVDPPGHPAGGAAAGEGGGKTVTALAITLCVVCQLFLVAGQVLLKHAMSGTKARTRNFIAGVACLTIWFFLWIGLLQRWDLSQI